MWFWTLCSLGLAGILDLVAGALMVHLLSEYFAYPLSWWQYAIGAFLGASPDVDLFYGFFKKKASGHHEYLTHRPILGVPFAAVVGWLLGGEFWAIAAGVGVFWHYLHDTEGFLGLEGGIAWFWPFSQKHWCVKNCRVISKMPEEHREGEGNPYDWFYESYLSPTRRSITELTLTSIFSGYVIGDVFGFYFGLAATALFWLAVAELWIVYRRPVRI
ncbi:MAG: metal-dependent hydrolase [bacterium]|nr:metal-dependent hydrolase [bacterium]